MAKRQFARECTACKKGMNEGYCIEGGIEYYCSKVCLNTEISDEEFMELYADGEGDSYWTDWSEDPEHFEDEYGEGVEIQLDVSSIEEPLYDALLAAFRAEAVKRGLTIDTHIFEDWRVVCRAHMNNEEV